MPVFARVKRPFPYAANGLDVELLAVGREIDILDRFFPGLEAAGYVERLPPAAPPEHTFPGLGVPQADGEGVPGEESGPGGEPPAAEAVGQEAPADGETAGEPPLPAEPSAAEPQVAEKTAPPAKPAKSKKKG